MTDTQITPPDPAATSDPTAAELASLDERVTALEAAGPASGSAFSFELVPTGRTHQVYGVTEPILDDKGNPEAEWTLFVTVDGSKVPLQTFSASFVQNHKIREQRLAARDTSSS